MRGQSIVIFGLSCFFACIMDSFFWRYIRMVLMLTSALPLTRHHCLLRLFLVEAPQHRGSMRGFYGGAVCMHSHRVRDNAGCSPLLFSLAQLLAAAYHLRMSPSYDPFPLSRHAGTAKVVISMNASRRRRVPGRHWRSGRFCCGSCSWRWRCATCMSGASCTAT